MSDSHHPSRPTGRDFIRQIIDRHRAEGRYDEIVTRFPPEPNGYLHIGHAKSICLNFGIAAEYGGRCHLRFDDTNPLTENEEFTTAIAADVRWLGYDWGPHLYHASDYFERMYEVAEGLIRKGLAYVDSASEEEIREARGSVTEPGRPTPDRDRPADESLDFFRRMRAGEFAEGELVLRGRIDLASPNMIMRDPVFYRIRHAHHYRTEDAWCIYPLYDFAHCLEDAFEGVSHSLCTLEFDNNREIYDWILDHAGFAEPRTHQYEFARLNLEYTVLSKRKLIELVSGGHVEGWDDPRLPTLAGLRRRGVPPESIRRFCDMIGVAKADSVVDVAKLEYAMRDVLNEQAPRALAVLDPLRVVVTTWPEDGSTQTLQAPIFPDRDDSPRRTLTLGRELWIERDDFAEDPPKGWKRLAPGTEVRLRNAYVIRCDEVVRDEAGRVVELRCSHDAATLGRNPEGRRVRGTIHWAGPDSVEAEVRLYDRLFSVADPNDVPEDGSFIDHLNPHSLEIVRARVEPALVAADSVFAAGGPETFRVQFERLGYFARDAAFTHEAPVFNRIVTLRDTWGARQRADDAAPGAGAGADTGSGAAAGPRAASSARSNARAQPASERRVLTPEERISDERRAAREADPELARRFTHYSEALGLSLEEADVLTGERALGDFFESALAALRAADSGAADSAGASTVAAWIVNDLRPLLSDGVASAACDGAALGQLIALVEADRVTRRAARDVLAELVEKGGSPAAIIERDGLEQLSGRDALLPHVDAALEAFPDKVEAYRAGNTNLLGLFMGQVMKRTGGTADPQAVRELLAERLGGGDDR